MKQPLTVDPLMSQRSRECGSESSPPVPARPARWSDTDSPLHTAWRYDPPGSMDHGQDSLSWTAMGENLFRNTRCGTQGTRMR